MAESPEDPGAESKLELPKLSLGFGRRKRDRDAAAAEPPSEQPPPEESQPEEALVGEPSEGPAPVDVSDDETTTLEAPAEETFEHPTGDNDAPPTDDLPAAEPAPEPASPPVEDPDPEPTAEPDPGPEPAPVGAEETAVLPGLETADEPGPEIAAALPADVPAEENDEERPRRRFSGSLTLPALDARIASAVAGLVVGLGIVVLTFGSARGCSAVKGTGSCGGIGLILLVAILVAAVLLGASLLRAFGVGDPLSSSFLAVGLVSVIAMLFFLPEIDSTWMVLVIPLLTAAAYLFSWWITRTFVESADQS